MGIVDRVMRQDTSLAAAFLSIDLGALRDNYRLLARRAGPAACAAVVKADAYGLGVARVAPSSRRPVAGSSSSPRWGRG